MPSLDIVSVLLTLFVDSPEAFSWKGLQDLTGMEVAPFSDQCTAEDVDMSEDDYDKALNFIVAWKDKESATTVREDVES